MILNLKSFPIVSGERYSTSYGTTLHRDMLRLRTLFVMEPLIEAINMMLPLFPKRAICRPAACAVYNTPLVFTPIT